LFLVSFCLIFLFLDQCSRLRRLTAHQLLAHYKQLVCYILHRNLEQMI